MFAFKRVARAIGLFSRVRSECTTGVWRFVRLRTMRTKWRSTNIAACAYFVAVNDVQEKHTGGFMAENNHTPPIPLVVPFHNEDKPDKVAGFPVRSDNECVTQTAGIAFTPQRSASRMRTSER